MCCCWQIEQRGDGGRHTGARSCFFGRIGLTATGISAETPERWCPAAADALQQLALVINGRRDHPEPAHTNKLSGSRVNNSILKKIGEESADSWWPAGRRCRCHCREIAADI